MKCPRGLLIILKRPFTTLHQLLRVLCIMFSTVQVMDVIKGLFFIRSLRSD